ncbi:DUF11 domain-containing protein [Methanobrevibacter sp.]|uniref:DUF11 domain-containing protein n=1 Tax=Methanobrevibacter sp. TaxID=66852 RepID=UPI0025F12A1D|nr:DUF11 domain-containing protein [Methanobrevibacter sp.]MBQ2962256.1 DUF11 domain-containing protein [Methanobrevibacter sp.]
MSDIDDDSSASDGNVLTVDDDSQSGSDDEVSSDNPENEGDFPDCNLTIIKEGDKKVKVGDEVEWKITLKNELDTAWNIHVQEKFPKNFDIVSVKASKGDYNKEMVHWEILKLNKGETATLTIKAKAKKAGNYTNKAELFTDSNNLNKNTTVKSDVEVVSEDKSKAAVKKNDNKKEKLSKKVKKTKDKIKTNKAQANATNQTNKKVTLENAGNPIMVLVISLFVVLGLGVLKKQ